MSSKRIEALRTALRQQRAVKIIAGIANTHMESVDTIVGAATIARATAVDVAAKVDVVRAVRAKTDLPVFASAIVPQALADAAEAGADVVELGNYDALYDQGLFFTHEEVLRLAQQTVDLVKGDALICVTIPGHLTLETQVKMAKALEAMGVDLLQTEGASRALSLEPKIQQLSAEEKAEITMNATKALSQAVSIPVMAASGIGPHNVVTAFKAGASAVGVGRCVSQLASQGEMVDAIERMMLVVGEHVRHNTPVLSQVS